MFLCMECFQRSHEKKIKCTALFLLFSSYSTLNVPGFPFPVDANNEIDFREEAPELFRLAGACKLVEDHSYITYVSTCMGGGYLKVLKICLYVYWRKGVPKA